MVEGIQFSRATQVGTWQPSFLVIAHLSYFEE